MRNDRGLMVLEVGDRATLRHPSAGKTVWTIRSIQSDGRCTIDNVHNARLVCKLTDLDPIATISPVHHRHRASDEATSVLAAERVSERLTAAQRKVLAALVAAGPRGMLDHDHEAVNGLAQDTAGKRRKELADAGFVMDSTERRKTPRGSLATVRVVTPAGIDWYRTEQQRGAA